MINLLLLVCKLYSYAILYNTFKIFWIFPLIDIFSNIPSLTNEHLSYLLKENESYLKDIFGGKVS